MNIEVTRHSVCAVDDQTNPLSLTIRIARSESLQCLVAAILSSSFLQFSSSHSTITGLASGQPIVRVHADFSSGHRPEFLISPDIAVETCLPNKLLEFEWAGSKKFIQSEPASRVGLIQVSGCFDSRRTHHDQ